MNESERIVKRALEQQKFKVKQNGWPDFLVHEPTSGACMAIEVKSGLDRIKPHQEEIHSVLKAFGLPVHIVRVTGSTCDLAGLDKRDRPNLKSFERRLCRAELCVDRALSAHPKFLEEDPPEGFYHSFQQLRALAQELAALRQEYRKYREAI